jgi:hypothetical protein
VVHLNLKKVLAEMARIVSQKPDASTVLVSTA